jgi:uncharacterized protein (UPF0548 family)
MRQLKTLEKLGVNYSLDNRSEFTRTNGWNIDSYEADLPPEPPGPPIDGGSFAICKSILSDYSFVDPKLIKGYFDPDTPLVERVMLLKVRVFIVFTFQFGVRVSQVIEECRDDVYTWGYAYRTLEGHFEQGEITFKVEKEADTGRTLFRINSYSRLGHIRNIFYRIGASLFGRKLQLRFANYALRKVQEMVAQRLGQSSSLNQ